MYRPDFRVGAVDAQFDVHFVGRIGVRLLGQVEDQGRVVVCSGDPAEFEAGDIELENVFPTGVVRAVVKGVGEGGGEVRVAPPGQGVAEDELGGQGKGAAHPAIAGGMVMAVLRGPAVVVPAVEVAVAFVDRLLLVDPEFQ